MRELRRREAERAVQQHLPRRVRDVILTADHMRNLHQRIVDHHREVVGGVPIGADDHVVADHVGAERDFAADQILEGDVDVLRHAEADHAALARLDPPARVLGRERAAGAAILRRTSGREILAAIVLEFLRRAEAVVGVAAGEQLVGVRQIKSLPLRLAIGAAAAADVGAFVPLEAEPAQVVEDALFRLLGRALDVGVFDAQDERAVVPAREQPVEERGAGVADVQLPGGTRGEPYSHLALSSATACAATASPRPTASTPSLVLPLMLTRSGSTPSASARRARIVSTTSLIFGRSRITVRSRLLTS